MKELTDEEIGQIGFDKFGLQSCDDEYHYFIEGFKLGAKSIKENETKYELISLNDLIPE